MIAPQLLRVVRRSSKSLRSSFEAFEELRNLPRAVSFAKPTLPPALAAGCDNAELAVNDYAMNQARRIEWPVWSGLALVGLTLAGGVSARGTQVPECAGTTAARDWPNRRLHAHQPEWPRGFAGRPARAGLGGGHYLHALSRALPEDDEADEGPPGCPAARRARPNSLR